MSMQLRLISDIKSKILSNEFMPGMELPSEKELCRKFNVSKGVTRNALKSLSDAGIIETIQGSGSFIKNDMNPVVNICLLYFYPVVDLDYIKGVTTEATKRFINVDYHRIKNHKDEQDRIETASIISNKKYSGFILGGSRIEISKYLESVDFDKPVVVMKPPSGEKMFNHVYHDPRAGIFQGVSSLLKKGAKRISFIVYKKSVLSSEGCYRFQAYREALEYFKIPYNENLISECPDILSMTEQIDKMVEPLLKQKTDAIIMASDEFAKPVYNYLEKKGLKIGKDILLLGYDNSPVCTTLSPMLSSIDGNYENIGKESVKRLVSMFVNNNEMPRTILIPTHLVER